METPDWLKRKLAKLAESRAPKKAAAKSKMPEEEAAKSKTPEEASS